MATGISVHVGVNIVSPSVFDVERVPPLRNCLKDSQAMFDIAKNRFLFDARDPFLGSNATFDNVVLAILEAAQELGDGDTFLFTFSGHGSQQSEDEDDLLGGGAVIDEPDRKDEGIVLFDKILLDDFLRRNVWSQFTKGVRIIGVADCCRGGSILSASTLNPLNDPAVAFPFPAPGGVLNADVTLTGAAGRAARRGRNGRSARPPSALPLSAVSDVNTEPVATGSRPLTRELGRVLRRAHIEASLPFYQMLKKRILTDERGNLKADLLTLSACTDEEDIPDGDEHGVFTQALLDLFSGGASPDDYDDLREKVEIIYRNQHRPQTPVITPEDRTKVAFRTRRPFIL